jgi:MtN3 and saliva related transmembrane protein
MFTKIIGFLAAVTSTVSLLPQLLQSLKTKSVADLSVAMLWNFVISSALWCIYGVMLASYAIVGTNIIMVLFAIWLLILKLKYD